MFLEERVLVSDIKGIIRDIIEEIIELKGYKVCLIDMVGIRESVDKIEWLGIEKSFKSLENCDIILGVFDFFKFLEKEDFNFMDIFNCVKKFCIVVLNKNDLVFKLEFEVLKFYFKIFYFILEINILNFKVCLKDLS